MGFQIIIANYTNTKYTFFTHIGKVLPRKIMGDQSTGHIASTYAGMSLVYVQQVHNTVECHIIGQSQWAVAWAVGSAPTQLDILRPIK